MDRISSHLGVPSWKAEEQVGDLLLVVDLMRHLSNRQIGQMLRQLDSNARCPR
jgi:hypothetical protein